MDRIPKMQGVAAPRVRAFGAVNWRGLGALYRREVARFMKVAVQTIGAPVVMALLLFAIFDFALGDVRSVHGVGFATFLIPGLVMMSMVQNAFANSSSSLLTAKVQGNIVDFLMPPLSAFELTLGFMAGGVTRGLAVGLATGLALWCLAPLPLAQLPIANALTALVFALLASAMLALAGLLAGIRAERFDHVSSIGNFVVMPFAFLSGTFYSVEALPAFWQDVAHLNPFFHAIDGFRYGMLGRADADPVTGALVLLAIDAALFVLVWRVVARGWRLKA